MAFDLSHFDPIASKFGLDPGGFRAALQHMWGGPGGAQSGSFQPNFPMAGGLPWWISQGQGAVQGILGGLGGLNRSSPMPAPSGSPTGGPFQALEGLFQRQTPQSGPPNLLGQASVFLRGSPSAYTGAGPGGYNPQTGQGSF